MTAAILRSIAATGAKGSKLLRCSTRRRRMRLRCGAFHSAASQSAQRFVKATTGTGDHQFMQIQINSMGSPTPSNVMFMFSNNTVYPTWNAPARFMYFTPTNMPPSIYSCMESGPAYYTDSTYKGTRYTSSTPVLQAPNWCGSAVAQFILPIDGAFQSKYIRTIDYGLPEYSAEIAEGVGTATLYIYNYNSSMWDAISTQSGSNPQNPHDYG